MTTRTPSNRVLVGAIGAGIGLVVDRVYGEPPLAVHPVARFGATMQRLEARTYADDRRAGLVHLLVGVGTAVALGMALQRVIGRGPATALAVAASVGGRMLGDEALAVGQALDDGAIDHARLRIRSLVGRDTAGLDATELSRAAIESLAENTVDSVTAPLFWATLGGAPAVLAHRAINTLDAMVGHRSARYSNFGWASARLDDVVNWLPARLSAAIVAALHPRSARTVWHIVRRDAPQHPSPNGGVIEAAFAAALGVRLGGANVYADRIEQRGVLGDGAPAGPADIVRAAALARRLGASFALGGVAAAITLRRASRVIGRRSRVGP